MGMEIKRHGSAQVIHLSGQLDAIEAQNLRVPLLEALQSNATLFVIDASGVTMVDSSGVGVFLLLHRKARERCVHFALVGLSGQPANLIHYLKIDTRISVFETLEQAEDAAAAGELTL